MKRPAAVLIAPLLVALAGCGERRPDFSVEDARVQLAAAFDRTAGEVAVYDDTRGREPDTWLVDFKLDDHAGMLQARFRGEPSRWALDGVREIIAGGEQPWQPLGVVIGRVRQEEAERAESTIERIEQLAALVERYALDHGNSYPAVDAAGLKTLLVGAGYVKRWAYDSDAWNNPIVYHASPDGEAYLILSSGADGAWDQPVSTYFRNTDTGNEAYEGLVADPELDFIWATGSFVQRYEPSL